MYKSAKIYCPNDLIHQAAIKWPTASVIRTELAVVAAYPPYATVLVTIIDAALFVFVLVPILPAVPTIGAAPSGIDAPYLGTTFLVAAVDAAMFVLFLTVLTSFSTPAGVEAPFSV